MPGVVKIRARVPLPLIGGVGGRSSSLALRSESTYSSISPLTFRGLGYSRTPSRGITIWLNGGERMLWRAVAGAAALSLLVACSPDNAKTLARDARQVGIDVSHDDAGSALDAARGWYGKLKQSDVLGQFHDLGESSKEALNSAPEGGKKVACAAVNFRNSNGRWPTTDADAEQALGAEALSTGASQVQDLLDDATTLLKSSSDSTNASTDSPTPLTLGIAVARGTVSRVG